MLLIKSGIDNLNNIFMGKKEKPFLIILEGHDHTGKDYFLKFLKENFAKKNVTFRDMSKFFPAKVSNEKKNAKKYIKRMKPTYEYVTEKLLETVKNSIMINWVRTERINSIFNKRENLESLLKEDLIRDKYKIITFTMLFIDYDSYITKSHYQLNIDEDYYSIKDFDDITDYFFQEMMEFPEKNFTGNDVNKLNLNENLDTEHIEILLDIYPDEEDSKLIMEDAWNLIYPIVCDFKPHIAPPINYMIDIAHQRK